MKKILMIVIGAMVSNAYAQLPRSNVFNNSFYHEKTYPNPYPKKRILERFQKGLFLYFLNHFLRFLSRIVLSSSMV